MTRRVIEARPLRLLCGLPLAALALGAQAQTLNWDANGTLPVNGNDTVTPANNVWDTTSLRWHNGTTYQAWNNAALSDAVFGGTAGTVTLGVPITAHNLTFSANNYILTGSTLTLGGVNPTIAVNTTTTTINSILAGTAGLIKSGTGTLALSGANTYTGVTQLLGGTLSITNNAALGAGPNVAANFIIGNGTTLNFNSTTIDRNFTLTGGTASMSAAAAGVYSGSPTLTASTVLQLIASGTFSGNFADTGANVLSLSKTVSGTVILSGTNTYSGQTLLSAGILRANSAGALSANSNLNLTGGGVVELGAGDMTRAVGTGANQVQWTGSGGFAAFGANRVVNLGGAGATLVWAGTPGFIGAGQTLTLASASATGTLDWQNPIDLNGASRTIQVNNGSAATDVTLSGVLSNGSVVYTGNGTVQLNAANTYTGVTSLNAPTVRVSTIGNGGTAGGLGAASNAAANLVFDNNASILTYVGAGESTDRNFSFGAATQAQLAASGTGALVWNGTATNPSGARTLILRGTNTATNIFAGTLGDGGGTLALTKNDAGLWHLTGANTYTGITSILGGTLEIDTLANGGVASNLGASSNAAANLVINNGTLRYTGAANASTDRNFTGVGTTGRIESSGTGTLTWNGTMTTTAATTFTLAGTNTGNNLFAGTLTDFNTAGALRTSLIKAGTGTWFLSGPSTHTGDTRIDAGLLTLNNATALSGGLAGDGATQGSALVFNGGVLGLTATSGDFNRAVGASSNLNQVRWTSSGGFAAFGGNRVVNLGGAGATQTWTAGGFVPNGQSLILSLANADSTIDFRNGIDFGAAARTVLVNDGTAATDAILSGVLTGAGGGLTKTGAGTLLLTANNTFTGTTTISTGVLQVGNGGTTGTLGAGAVVDSGQLIINRSDAYTIGGVISSTGTLLQNGTGTTILAANNTYSGTTTINAGTLQLGNGGATGTLGGGAVINNSVLAINRSSAVTTSSAISGNGTLRHDGTGTTTLSGVNTFTGPVRLNAGVLAVSTLTNGGVASNLGAATNAAANLNFDGGTLRHTGAATATDRNFLIEDGGATLDGSGSGVLTWNGTASYDIANQARSLTLTGTTSGNIFAGALADNGSGALALTKSGTGRWILAGSNTYSGTTTISAGTLQVGNGGTTGTLGSGAVVNNATLTFLRSDALTVGNTITGTGTINQSGAGTTTLSGSAAAAATNVVLGTLQVTGSLTTPTVALTATTTLDVRGSVEAAGSTTATITGSTGVDTVLVASGATLRATGDFGNGSDVLDVSGTVNTGAGTLSLGGSNDTLTIRDGANVVGTLDGGTGTNTLNTAIAGTASLGAVTNFQTLLKTSGGTLNINGPGVSGFTTVNVSGGTLNVGAAGSVSGATATTVASGATLNVSGSYVTSAGADTFAVSGTVTGVGTIDLGAGNDTLTLNDGAVITATIGGGAQTTSDSVVLNNAGALSLGASLTGFEQLTKQNTGVATLTGIQTYTTSTALNAGTLLVAGELDTPTLTLGDNTTLNVQGTVQAVGATPLTLTGSAGANTVLVASGATLRATGDFGNGSDLLDVSGTVNTGAGTLSLGTGDDTLTIHDGTNIVGTVAGGTGNNTFNTAIATSANLGAVTGFQTLLKTGVGTLNINGPAASSFTTVNANAGTINIAAAGSINGFTTASVASGATLNVSGSFVASAGADALTVAGTVSGAGIIDLAAGNDVLTLNDGALLTATIGGGAQTTFDSVVLNNAGAFTLGAGSLSGFEQLTKQNTGVAILTGIQTYTSGTTLTAGTLLVAGELDTPTLSMGDGSVFNVQGTAQAVGATPLALTGSAGANTVLVAGGATLRATGDLGSGSDLLDVTGTLNTGAGSLSLGGGDDTLTIHDGTSVVGLVDGGTGNNTFNADIAAVANLGAVTNFQTLLKTSGGLLNINGPGVSNFSMVSVAGGTLAVGALGSISGVSNTNVASGATLTVNGSYTGTAGADQVTVAGTLDGSGSIDLGAGADLLDLAGTLNLGTGTFNLGDGDDTFTIHDGTTVIGTVAGGTGINTFNTDINTVADLGALTGFQTLQKTGVGTLNINGPAASVFDTVLVNSGIVHVAVGATVDPTTTVVDAGATLQVDGIYLGTAGNDTLTVSGTVAGVGTIDLGLGDDVLTLNDGAVISAVIGGGGQTSVDSVVLNNAAAFTLDGASLSGFEQFTKQNTGVATLTGTQSYGVGTTVAAGTLVVAGALDTPTLNLGDDSTLSVQRTVQAGGATPLTIAGSGGANTVLVASGATLRATGDLGAGADLLDVAGTLDTGAGSLSLGADDDTLTIHDGTSITGLVDGGSGNNTFNADIAGVAGLGAVSNFQTLLKTSGGTLNLNGPGVSNFSTVSVAGGTLGIGPAGSLNGVSSTAVANGATLSVSGSYLGSAGNDTMTISGTVSGGGSVDLGAGDDVLTLNDGAAITANIGGGAQTSADSVVLNNASALTLDAASLAGFEQLTKQNTGVATLTGIQTYTSGTTLTAGTLLLAGELDTPTLALGDGSTLTVQGTAQAAGPTPLVMTGSAGANTVFVAGGATLRAMGDLGAGADLLDVAGTLDTGAGSLSLGADNDTFTIHDGTSITGLVDGGTGTNTFNTNIATVADLGAVTGFQALLKTGAGTLNIHGPTASAFNSVSVNSGIVHVAAGATVDPVTTVVAAGATLQVDGSYLGTAGSDTLTVAGTVSGAGTIDLGAGDDLLSLTDGATLNATVNGGAHAAGDTVAINNANAFTFDTSRITGFEILTKQGAGTLTLSGTPAFTGIDINAGTLTSSGTLSASRISVASAGALSAGGTIVGDVTNAGVLNIGGAPFGTLTIRGKYVGAGGQLDMRVALGNDSSPADRLTIDGGSATGATRVHVINQNGLGARTTGGGIQLIATANSATTAPDAFALDGPVMAGAFRYDLFHGVATDADPEGWYLRSLQQVRDVASVATAVVPLAHLYGLSVLGTLNEREGAEVATTCDSGHGCQWGRVLYLAGNHDGGGTAANGANFDYDIAGIQLGTDLYRNAGDSRADRAGVYLVMGPANGYVDRDDSARAGNAESLASTVGAYWTRRSAASYVDTNLLGTYFSRVDLEPREDTRADTNGWAAAASVEAGHSFRLGDEWSLTPQGQVIVQHLEQDDTETAGTTIRFGSADTIVARAGLELGVLRPRGGDDQGLFHAWLRANYWSELSGSTETTLAAPTAPATVFRTEFDDDWVELSAGISAQINERTSVHASVTASQGVNASDSRAVQGNLGVRVQW